MKEIFEMLRKHDGTTKFKSIQIAKGCNKLPESISEAWTRFKNDLKWQ